MKQYAPPTCHFLAAIWIFDRSPSYSFEKYKEGETLAGYKKFCENFLGHLALMSYKDIKLGRMLREYIEGIPLDSLSHRKQKPCLTKNL